MIFIIIGFFIGLYLLKTNHTKMYCTRHDWIIKGGKIFCDTCGKESGN